MQVITDPNKRETTVKDTSDPDTPMLPADSGADAKQDSTGSAGNSNDPGNEAPSQKTEKNYTSDSPEFIDGSDQSDDKSSGMDHPELTSGLPSLAKDASTHGNDHSTKDQMKAESNVADEPELLTPKVPSTDLLERITGLYRLLDLRNDDGSVGIVDKVIIDQDSVALFANNVRPGSYQSTTQVNFRFLDEASIKPLGVYGSISAIADFFEKLGIIDQETRALLVAPRNEHSGVSIPSLRPGIYLLDRMKPGEHIFHIIFWPEDGTWQDNSSSSVSRNRVTFMRYMTKLCDQLVCLISDEHSKNLVWKNEAQHVAEDEDNDDETENLEAYDRLFTFSVQQTNEENETAVAKTGFSLPHKSISTSTNVPPGFPVSKSSSLLDSQLVVGDTSQAILQVEFVPERQRETNLNETVWTTHLRNKLSANTSPTIILGDGLDAPGLHILLEHGLWSRCGSQLESQWKAQMKSDEIKRQEDRKAELSEKLSNIDNQISMLKRTMPFFLVDTAINLYPSLMVHRNDLLTAVMGPQILECLREGGELVAKPEVASWIRKNATILESKLHEIHTDLGILETRWKDPYITLKRRLRRIVLILEETPGLDAHDIQRLVDLIDLKSNFTEEVYKVTSAGDSQSSRNVFQVLTDVVSDGLARLNPNNPIRQPPKLDHMEDTDFATFLESLVATKPVFLEATKAIHQEMIGRIVAKIKKLESLSHSIGKAMQDNANADIKHRYEARTKQETDCALESLKVQIQNALATETYRNGSILTIQSATAQPRRHFSTYNDCNDSYRLQGTVSKPQSAGLRYMLRLLEVKSDDMQQSARDKNFVCQPIIRSSPPPSFTLPLDTQIRLIRLVGKDSCLIVLQTDEHLQIYLERLNALGSVIDANKPKKQLHIPRVGTDCVFALDETRRLLAILSCHSGSIIVYIYTYDVEAKAFHARGGAVNITKWYSGPPELPVFTQVAFVAGTEELLLVEATGLCRIFSLVTENFRPSSLDLAQPINAASSSPDGTCLFLATKIDGNTRIWCYHWASFGSNKGIELEIPHHIPSNCRMEVSSVGHKSITHILFLDTDQNVCRSVLVQITCKSSDFTVHSNLAGFGTGGKPESSINNSLIDCHAEVWTRFPVYGGAVKRETSKAAIHQARSILFVSSASPSSFPQYFASLIRDFEAKTRKPTRGLLKHIRITSSQELPSDFLSGTISTSELPLGEWLMGMFCLIPIHLAVTNSNRFNPLRDGMASPEFERELLGANVIQIAQALSFGWYESIFTSYLAKKPVKVVTSMGEQSVGKSFALNHFVDTSFAGSAMRCTEGVWLSVTPTRDYVVVAMDFEGFHSIERSAQEDTLMVLLNAAISNFVIFRNNFAMSRDIAGLFTSFQSSTNVLDTASNESLFNGTLGIIIKDVIDSDTKEIVNEFHQKFQRIVHQEKGDNFITKLHKGNFDIIPWPVIESSRFYALFGALKTRLDSQPLTHKHAGAFIGDLKMLMAKLKANDWGALDLNLAVQRADQLSALLAFALAFGTTDPSVGEPLKNFDTDEAIPGEAQKAVFYLESATKKAGKSALSVFFCLTDLRRSFPEYFNRFEMQEDDFFCQLTAHLQALVTSRIEYVKNWLKINTERFGGKAEIITLFRVFDNWAKELRAGVALCGSKCSSCWLLCVEHKLHDGNSHDCRTTHKCPQICSFVDHPDTSPVPPCGMPAGHSGRHVCLDKPHLCDVPCHLNSKDGCLKACSKPMDHDEDEEHLCAANVHACGEACSLVKGDGTRICERTCVVDCRRDHQLHTCDRSLACPIKCQLCSSFCAAGDHFHALEEGAIHLCGQIHGCGGECEQFGICEVATTPRSIESKFVGKHATYQFTMYTQKAKRLDCVVPIKPNLLAHEGPHQHSLDPAAFHYCQEQCKHCGYYCTLPLNHPQNQHETSHGSMAQTEWVVEGDENTALELQGRKYATGDSGAPMLCSMICKTLGRHAHIDHCRSDEDGKCAGGAGIEHVQRQRGAISNKDWITHRLFWARSGFRDPYTNAEQSDFDLCEHRCGGEEHDPDVNPGVAPSYCVLPLFHPPADAENAPPLGHASIDGHAYHCKNPAQMQRSFHIFFALDRSGSMAERDRVPLPNSPATQRIVQRANNRFGAVVSSLYGFWTARDAAIRSGGPSGMRRDAYTIIPFGSSASVALSNNTASNPDGLLQILLSQATPNGGTNFTHALQMVQREMERTWATERSPVVVFLSDGECQVADHTVYDLCRRAVTLGKPLSLHAVSFGSERSSHSLRRMAAIAGEVYTSAPRDPLAPGGNPCTFSSALDTIQLTDTFMSIATSLKNPRAALSSRI